MRWLNRVLLVAVSGPPGRWWTALPAAFAVSTFVAIAAPLGRLAWVAWAVSAVTGWWLVSRGAELLYFRDLVRRFDRNRSVCPFCGYPAPGPGEYVCSECGERPYERIARLRRALGLLAPRQ